MDSVREHHLTLAQKLLEGTPLTAAEYEEVVEAIEQGAGRELSIPDSNLVPWPESDELRRLARRSARRRDKQT